MKIYDYNGKKNVCGNRIREARFKRRLTQADLAAQKQINGVIIERDSISRIEIGTRFVTDYKLKVFTKVLRVEVMWLLTEETKTNKSGLDKTKAQYFLNFFNYICKTP